MAYSVKLWDKTEVLITDKQADVVKHAKLEGIRAIEINGNVYDSSSIAQITKIHTRRQGNSKQLASGQPVDNRGSIAPSHWEEARKRIQQRVENKSRKS